MNAVPGATAKDPVPVVAKAQDPHVSASWRADGRLRAAGVSLDPYAILTIAEDSDAACATIHAPYANTLIPRFDHAGRLPLNTIADTIVDPLNVWHV
jgi:hypothetical protein